MKNRTINNDSIIFDIDGTLWNACPASAKGWNIGLAKLGIDKKVTPRQLESVTGNPFDTCIEMLLPGLQKQYPNLLDTLNSCEIESVKSDGGTFYDGVLDGIKTLSGSYKIFLVSNCQDWYMKLFLEISGLEPFLSGFDCHGFSNLPKSEMLTRILHTYSLKNPVYVGDTGGDECAAHLADMDFFHVTYGFGSPIRKTKRGTSGNLYPPLTSVFPQGRMGLLPVQSEVFSVTRSFDSFYALLDYFVYFTNIS